LESFSQKKGEIMEDKTNELKDKFIIACRILMNEGLIEAQYNISCRLDKKRMLANENVGPAFITHKNIKTVSLDEDVTGGNVHPAIYRAREDVNAIVHAHPIHAIALSTVEEEFRPVHNYGVLFHGKIKVYKSHGQVKTKERAQAIAELLGDGIAVLQRGHGTVVVGKSIEEAVLATIYLEEAAKVYFLTKVMGVPQYIPNELSEKITKEIFNERSNKKAWDHYASKV
jgi:ribulose-5-phosphate 4-epimerase/fuculose-1-phosphate aldolase